MSIRLLAVTVFCAAVVLGSASLAGANTTIYGENFDDPLLTDGQWLSTAPFLWSVDPLEVDMVLGTLDPPLHPGWVGRAIDMSASRGYWGGMQYKNLPRTIENDEEWILSFDAWVADDTFNSGIGFGTMNRTLWPNQPLIGVGYRASADFLNPGETPNWYVDARAVTGNGDNWIVMNDDGSFRNRTVRVEIHANAVNNEVYATVSNGTSMLDSRNYKTMSSIEDRECFIGAVRVGVECYRGLDGIDIDNILVEKVGGGVEPTATVGASNKAVLDSIMTQAAPNYIWVLWGKVTVDGVDSFTIDDGSGVNITVSASGHGLTNGDYVSVRGTLTPGETPTLASQGITKHSPVE